MTHNRYFRLHQRFDQVYPLFRGTLDFDSSGSGFFDETGGINDCLFLGQMKRKIGHVPHNKASFRSSGNRFGVMDHLIHCDRYGVLIA